MNHKQILSRNAFTYMTQIYKHNTYNKIQSLENYLNIKPRDAPKDIYRTWCSESPKEDCGGRKGSDVSVSITHKSCPDYTHYIYNDDDIDDFFIEFFGETDPVTLAYKLINPVYKAAKADFFRYVLIYVKGGIYLDMKSCITSKIPKIPPDKEIWVSRWKDVFMLSLIGISTKPATHIFNNGELQQWYLYAKQGCRALKEVIEQLIFNIMSIHNDATSIDNCKYLYSPGFIDTITPVRISTDYTKSKIEVLTVTGPYMFTKAIEESSEPGLIHEDDSINNYIKYQCTAGDISSKSKHYSQITEPLIL